MPARSPSRKDPSSDSRQHKLFRAAQGETIDSFDLDSLRAKLLDWFAREKRALPWRADRDPYRVWISEAMLQQTRVETVIPYFARFLARFPTLSDLAAAPLEDVLAHWSGLGYYRRARTLHAAAQAIVERHGGVFPRTREALLDLPGVGPYTAGAIASIAFDLCEPLVDGNVARVFARIFALDLEPDSKAFQTELWDRAERLVRAGDRPGEWNQALMELGATVCTPRTPSCGACPVRDLCRARADDRVDELPRSKVRTTPIDVELLVVIVREGDRILLERRSETGRMAGMWQFPTIETSGDELIAPKLWPDGVSLLETEPLGSVRHTITRHRIRARVAAARIARNDAESSFVWHSRDALDALALTGMTKKILRAKLADR